MKHEINESVLKQNVTKKLPVKVKSTKIDYCTHAVRQYKSLENKVVQSCTWALSHDRQWSKMMDRWHQWIIQH